MVILLAAGLSEFASAVRSEVSSPVPNAGGVASPSDKSSKSPAAGGPTKKIDAGSNFVLPSTAPQNESDSGLPFRPWTTPTVPAKAETKSGGPDDAPFFKENGIIWAKGQGEGLLGGVARIKIDAGGRMTESRGVRTWLGLRKLPTNGNELGLIVGPKGVWAALAVMLPITNLNPAQVEAQLPALLPDLLRNANQTWGRETNVARANNRLEWVIEPQVDVEHNRMQWCLERTEGGQSQLLPGAAFFTARGTVVLHFFGPPDLRPGLCFGMLRNISILSPPKGVTGDTLKSQSLKQIFVEPRLASLAPRIAPRSDSSKGLATQTNGAGISKSDTSQSEAHDDTPSRFGDNSDQIVIGLLALAAAIVIGLLLGTRPVRRSRRHRPRGSKPHTESVR